MWHCKVERINGKFRFSELAGQKTIVFGEAVCHVSQGAGHATPWGKHQGSVANSLYCGFCGTGWARQGKLAPNSLV